MKILFLGCHCDDIELGCGATVNKYLDEGHEIMCHTFSQKSIWKGEEIETVQFSKEALSLLGVKELSYSSLPPNYFYLHRQELWYELNTLECKFNPDVVFTTESDFQQDHESLFNETLRNFKSKTIIAYKPTIRNSPDQVYNHYEKLDKRHLEIKKKAISLYELYKDVIYFKPENIESLVRTTGVCINEEFAEGSKIIRLVS